MEFKPRFRRHAFGWKSQPAIQRLKQAVSEIKKAGRPAGSSRRSSVESSAFEGERALIHVSGPEGAGKTTFIEAVLGAQPPPPPPRT